TLQKRHVDGYKQSIPTLLVMLKKHLMECGGAEVEGIFRLAPDQDACKRVKDQINTGEYGENCSDPNILANLIKVFFRELPVNVLNVVSDESIHKISRLTPQDTIAEMEAVFGETNEIVYWLLDLMAEIVMNEDSNKMSVKNMAIVMSPNLYAVTSENAMVALTMAQKVAEFTTNILAARLLSKYNYQPR
ncbi:gacA, partial [Symbiodinium microadriaticum]